MQSDPFVEFLFELDQLEPSVESLPQVLPWLDRGTINMTRDLEAEPKPPMTFIVMDVDGNHPICSICDRHDQWRIGWRESLGIVTHMECVHGFLEWPPIGMIGSVSIHRVLSIEVAHCHIDTFEGLETIGGHFVGNFSSSIKEWQRKIVGATLKVLCLRPFGAQLSGL